MKRPNNKFLLVQYLFGYAIMAYFLIKFGFPIPLVFGLIAISLSLAGGSMYLSKHYSHCNVLLMLLVVLLGTVLLFLMFKDFY